SYAIDDDLVGSRLLSWMQKDNNVQGALYQNTTLFQKYNGNEYESRDVWEDPMALPGTNGDGYVMYPGEKYNIKGPIGTLRLEAIRDGMEDYEYLWMAEQRMEDTADELGIENFSTDEALQVYYDRLFESTSN